MNHPTPETWMSFLYDDGLNETEKRECRAHLQSCSECQSQVAAWGEARTAMDRWQTPAVSRRAPVWKWAVAAGFIFAAGIGIGRLMLPGLEAGKINSVIDAKVQEAVRREFKAGREVERKEMLALLRGIEQQRALEYAVLRNDLETVAVQAEDKIESTQQEIGQLATLAQINLRNK